jgi:N-acetyl-beta-hexosaminidase
MDEHMDALNEAKSRLEKVETKLARPGAQGGSDKQDGEIKEAEEYRSAFLELGARIQAIRSAAARFSSAPRRWKR